eukprot:3145390-Pyramimonas_sp.AAC.2
MATATSAATFTALVLALTLPHATATIGLDRLDASSSSASATAAVSMDEHHTRAADLPETSNSIYEAVKRFLPNFFFANKKTPALIVDQVTNTRHHAASSAPDDDAGVDDTRPANETHIMVLLGDESYDLDITDDGKVHNERFVVTIMVQRI